MKDQTIHPFDPWFFIGVGVVVEHNGNLVGTKQIQHNPSPPPINMCHTNLTCLCQQFMVPLKLLRSSFSLLYISNILMIYYHHQQHVCFLPFQQLIGQKAWLDFKIPSQNICIVTPFFQYVFLKSYLMHTQPIFCHVLALEQVHGLQCNLFS